MTELLTKHEAEFAKFYELYMAYNEHTNISAIRDREGVYSKHFADSLESLPYIQECIARHPERSHCHPERSSVIARSEATKQSITILDIGTGGGFPAVPLAIVLQGQPVEITALDSVGKKTKFVESVKQELQLEQLKVVKARAEDLKGQRYDIITSRALAMLSESIPYVAALLKPGGIYIAYKKLNIADEIKQASQVLNRHKMKLTQHYAYGEKQLLIYTKA